MCIIIDANAVHEIANKTRDGLPVLQWIFKGKGGGLIVGGHLKTELARAGMAPTLVELNRAGRLHSVDDVNIDSIAAEVAPRCRSNDSHVVAIVKISRCSLLFSKDIDLGRDVQNREIIDHQVHIYKNRDHAHLLRECRCG
jgi:hypothetical protein